MCFSKWYGIVVAMFAIQALVLFFFGQPPICECGFIKVWEGAVLSSGNSQHLTDWYTFSHIIHGILFFWLITWLRPKWTLMQRLIAALSIEISWEIIENMPFMIEHYRQQALAQGYVGDSILNSLSDTFSALFGLGLCGSGRAGLPVALWNILELRWGASDDRDIPIARFSATRVGAIGDGRTQLFVLDTAPIAPGGAPPQPDVAASAGDLRNIVLQPNRETGGLRLSFEFNPAGAPLVELRARLLRSDVAVSETWVHRWT